MRFMRLIPVIDLMKGQAVHAYRGERQKYKPVNSVLCDTADPLALARAFRDRLCLNEIYIADLDAIQGFGPDAHRDLITFLARNEQIRIILDAGISGPESARLWLDAGVAKAVVGAETISTLAALREFPARIEQDRLVFSLDMREGQIVSRCSGISAMSPMQALEQLHSTGWKEVILLDLNRVGSGGGIDDSLVCEARSRFPSLELLAGGGIAVPEQLFELESLGLDGVLLATALHSGAITARHVSKFLE